jgi:hypothetical protein
MQFHHSVMPDLRDLHQLEIPPTFAFCTSWEHQFLVPAVAALPETTWIITERDRVVGMRDGAQIADFAFSSIDSPVDTTGAGDLLAGGVIGCLLRGVPLEHAIRFGAGVAALSLADRGSEIFGPWWVKSSREQGN